MNDTNPISTQWLHYYHQPTASVTNPVAAVTSGGHSETTTSTIMTTSFMTTNTSTISSPSNSTSMLSGTNHLNPQGGGTVARPIRRRSRASRRTPTTLLNASTTNFRSLVQQFTGCHNTYKGSNSFGTQKGPLNLSFGMPRNQNEYHNQQVLGTSSSSRIAPFGCSFYNPQPAQKQEQQWHNQQKQQEHQEMYTKQAASNMQSGNLDDFAIDDVSDLQELMDVSSSFSGSRKDGYYF